MRRVTTDIWKALTSDPPGAHRAPTERRGIRQPDTHAPQRHRAAAASQRARPASPGHRDDVQRAAQRAIDREIEDLRTNQAKLGIR